jgi:hypothetical protein
MPAYQSQSTAVLVSELPHMRMGMACNPASSVITVVLLLVSFLQALEFLVELEAAGIDKTGYTLMNTKYSWQYSQQLIP